MHESTTPIDGDSIEILSFSVAEQEYSLDIQSVREIRGWSKTTPLPMAPDYIHGIINLRGVVLPVIDLSARLGFKSSEPNQRSVIIVSETDQEPVGLQVDSVSDILTVSPDEVRPPPRSRSSDQNEFLLGIAVQQDAFIRMLNIETVL